MSKAVLMSVVFALLTAAAVAQKCTEQSIRDAVTSSPLAYASDVYYVVGPMPQPVVGRDKVEQSRKQVEASRKNYSGISEHPQKIAVDSSGEMAYEYGMRGGSWDDAQSGRHMSLDGSYLRVWRVEDGRCVIAAMTGRHDAH